MADLCNEMKLCSERCTELEARLVKEKNLRKQIEREQQHVYDAKNKVGYDDESCCSHASSESNSSSDESNAEKSATRKVVVLQTGKGQRSRRNLKCTKK